MAYGLPQHVAGHKPWAMSFRQKRETMVRNKVKREPEFLEDVEIIDAGSEGMSVAKPEGRVVFIPFGVPGDVVDIQVYKRKKNFFEGKIVNFKKLSDKRVEPVCQHFGLCGGCKW